MLKVFQHLAQQEDIDGAVRERDGRSIAQQIRLGRLVDIDAAPTGHALLGWHEISPAALVLATDVQHMPAHQRPVLIEELVNQKASASVHGFQGREERKKCQPVSMALSKAAAICAPTTPSMPHPTKMDSSSR